MGGTILPQLDQFAAARQTVVYPHACRCAWVLANLDRETRLEHRQIRVKNVESSSRRQQRSCRLQCHRANLLAMLSAL